MLKIQRIFWPQIETTAHRERLLTFLSRRRKLTDGVSLFTEGDGTDWRYLPPPEVDRRAGILDQAAGEIRALNPGVHLNVLNTLGHSDDGGVSALLPNQDTSQRTPAIVFYHGEWTGDSPAQFTEHAKHFGARGLVTILVEYRVLQAPLEPPLICVQDAKSALRWIRVHAGQLGVAAHRHAASAALVEGLDGPREDFRVSARPEVIVLFNPVVDNCPTEWGYERVGQRWREFSLLSHMGVHAPPTIIFIGSEDKLVPVLPSIVSTASGTIR